jgi:hypothetical protein
MAAAAEQNEPIGSFLLRRHKVLDTSQKFLYISPAKSNKTAGSACIILQRRRK